MILNSQPQVSYALMDLMVKINAVNMEVFQVSHSYPFNSWYGLTRLSLANAFVIRCTPTSCTRPASASTDTSTSDSHWAYTRSQTPRIPSSTPRSIISSEPSTSGIPSSASYATSSGTASSSTGHHGITSTPSELARRSKGTILSIACKTRK